MRKMHRYVRRAYIVAKDKELAEIVRQKASTLFDAYRNLE
jgi:hypothetical protein